MNKVGEENSSDFGRLGIVKVRCTDIFWRGLEKTKRVGCDQAS